MNNNKYLPIGSTIAKKYEVIDILGEDEFEILYLVRDLQRKGSFFVLKELFLETFSSREQQIVSTIPEAEGVFNKRKKQIMEEIELQKLKLDLNEIKIYGYEEDNETIYTIMEFSNNASLEKYLQYTSTSKSSLPTLEALLNNEKRSRKFFFLLKLFLILSILLALVFYGYQYFEKNQMAESLEKLEESVALDYFNSEDIPEVSQDKEIEKIEEEIKLQSKPKIVVLEHKKDDKNSTIKSIVNERKKDTLVSKDIKDVNSSVELMAEALIIKDSNEENMTKIGDTNLSMIVLKVEPKVEPKIDTVKDDVNKTLLTQNAIKSFLDEYINSVANDSADKTLKYYDTRLKRYFKFKNASHETIRRSQEHYNKKWSNRQFKIASFEIVKRYTIKERNYFDLKTVTVWTIKNKKGKKLSGKSRGRMTIKELDNGFKITLMQ